MIKNPLNLIYVLLDPDTYEVRYVGLSTRGLERPREHIRPSSVRRAKGYKGNWLRKLFSEGKTPLIRVIQQWFFIPYEDLCAAEVYWINYFNDLGCPLTNLCIGGQGPVGYTHTPEAIEKIRDAGTGRKYPNRKKPDFREGWLDELSEKMKDNKFALGHQHTEEWKASASKRLKGNKHAEGMKHSQEWKKEASRRLKGNKHRLGKIPWNKGDHLDICKNGHEQIGSNVYTYLSGKQKCRVCERERARKKRAADKEA